MNEVKNLAKRIGKVIEKLTDDLNERFKIYNEFIIELDERLTEQQERIKELETQLEQQVEINKTMFEQITIFTEHLTNERNNQLKRSRR